MSGLNSRWALCYLHELCNVPVYTGLAGGRGTLRVSTKQVPLKDAGHHSMGRGISEDLQGFAVQGAHGSGGTLQVSQLGRCVYCLPVIELQRPSCFFQRLLVIAPNNVMEFKLRILASKAHSRW